MDDEADDLYDSGYYSDHPQFYLHNNAAGMDEVRAPNGDEIYPGYGDDSSEICAQLRRWHAKERTTNPGDKELRELVRLRAREESLRLEVARMRNVLGTIIEAAYRFQVKWVIEAVKVGMGENAVDLLAGERVAKHGKEGG